MHFDKEPNIVHQGRGGYVEIGEYRFEIEMQVAGSTFCIYFPKRDLDKSIIEAKKVIERFIHSDPEMWELGEYEQPHGFYDAMTVNERLIAAGLLEQFEASIKISDAENMRRILVEVEVPSSSIEKIIKNA